MIIFLNIISIGDPRQQGPIAFLLLTIGTLSAVVNSVLNKRSGNTEEHLYAENMTEILVVANTARAGLMTKGLSGGDRILIEVIKRIPASDRLAILTGATGRIMFEEYGLRLRTLVTTNYSFKKSSVFNFLLHAFLTTLKGLFLVHRHFRERDNLVIYSASDLLPDLLPAMAAKIWGGRNCKLVVGFYIFAPALSDSPYRGARFVRYLLHRISKSIALRITLRLADMVWVTSEPDKDILISKYNYLKPVIVVKGGVDLSLPRLVEEPLTKTYDAVFIGRLHPQKGVIELVEIWDKVCAAIPDAKLAIIGNGDLEEDLRKKIAKSGLEGNIKLFGFVDGLDKIRIFKDSKIVVHPAIFDSGGMAAAEAMSCGLPGVSFDLPALKTYYPIGMVKVDCFNLDAFAEAIIRLLRDESLYKSKAAEALKLAEQWDWNKRGSELAGFLRST
jgi:glycosyltransferase involved in cell wall biosynthesis